MKKANYKIVPIFETTIKDGKLEISDDEKRRMVKFALSQNDGEYITEIRKKVSKRSKKQNNALWGIPVQIIYENTFGQFEDDEEVYRWLEEKFSPKKIKTVAGETTFIKIPLKKLDSVTFGEVYLKIQKWSAKFLNLQIPDPDPNWHLRADVWEEKENKIKVLHGTGR